MTTIVGTFLKLALMASRAATAFAALVSVRHLVGIGCCPAHRSVVNSALPEPRRKARHSFHGAVRAFSILAAAASGCALYCMQLARSKTVTSASFAELADAYVCCTDLWNVLPGARRTHETLQKSPWNSDEDDELTTRRRLDTKGYNYFWILEFRPSGPDLAETAPRPSQATAEQLQPTTPDFSQHLPQRFEWQLRYLPHHPLTAPAPVAELTLKARIRVLISFSKLRWFPSPESKAQQEVPARLLKQLQDDPKYQHVTKV